MEAVLRLAIRLHNCREASKPKQSHAATANAVEAWEDCEQELEGPKRKNKGASDDQNPQNSYESAKIDALVRMVENIALTQKAATTSETPYTAQIDSTNRYQYHGDRQTQGLSHVEQPFRPNYPNQRGSNFRGRRGFSNNYRTDGYNQQPRAYAPRNAWSRNNSDPSNYQTYRRQGYNRPAGETSYHNNQPVRIPG